jgi:hypothetical protein
MEVCAVRDEDADMFECREEFPDTLEVKDVETDEGDG